MSPNGNKYMNDEENPELKLAFGFLQNTGENVFLTGKAGTGKTTFLHNLKKISLKRMVVLAPTGVAAINAKGATIHSFFQMPFGPQVPGVKTDYSGSDHFSKRSAGNQFRRFSREKLNIIRSLDLVVIDEISMVRADLLDGIDEVLRKFRDRDKPFGGVQLLMIGDLQQLAPVVKDDEWEILKAHYDTPFFFGSKALKQSNYITIELKRIYRQSDQEFIDLLNKVRYGDKNPDTLFQINKRYVPDFNIDSNGGIILTTHNYQAQRINEDKMRKLAGKPHTFTAKIEGDFPEYSYPTDFELTLKTDAQVMFVKNDVSSDKRYFNGKIGTVQAIDNGVIYVLCPGENSTIPVGVDSWQNLKYGLNSETNEIEETVNGTFTQYPLKAAWAITIHKSQGLTFDKIVIDAGAAFAHGQVYVALSRCRTLDGLVLTSPISARVLINNTSVSEFNKSAEENQPGEIQLENARITYQQKLLRELFDFSPFQRRISNVLKIMNENRGGIHSSLIEKFEAIAAEAKTGIMDVAEKFNNQISQYLQQEPDITQNATLQERAKKAATYFADKTETSIRSQLQRGEIDIDNQETLKLLTDAFKRLDEETIKKCACLEICRKGFSISSYLEARAKATIEKPVVKQSSIPQEYNVFAAHPVLHEKLKSWRAEKASSNDLPHYMILPHKTMIEICNQLPTSLAELKTIKGMGSKKLKSFGTELLKMISQYVSENDIALTVREEQQLSPKIQKQSTKQTSYDLFKSGKTVAEIASQRGLTLSTIEGHLSHFISTGELSIYQFISSQKVTEISDYFKINNTREIGTAKAHFGEGVSFSELRMVIGHLGYMREECL
jgi:hypothetical protein